MLTLPTNMTFESFSIDHLIDEKKRYRLELDPALPLSIKALFFQARPGDPRLNWHERLEIFVAVEGEGDFSMGNEIVHFEQGDILVVQNMKLHGISRVSKNPCRAISIAFQSDLISNPGLPVCNYALLNPFHAHAESPLIVRGKDNCSAEMHGVINKLLNVYFEEHDDATGRYLFLFELVYLLSKQFKAAGMDYAEYVSQQQRIRRLAKLLQYVQSNFADHISIELGAKMSAMSLSNFMRFFKKSTGTTFVAHLTQVRINVAAEMLLSNPEQSISEIAAATGFPDQSYFGRVFHKRYGVSPLKFRKRTHF